MTTEIATRLDELESIITRGLTTFVEVGTALMEIRDAKLYRESHATFEAYVKERWGWERRNAYQYIEAAEVAANVHLNAQPPTLSHASLLAPFSPDEQQALAPQIADLTVREAREVVAQHRNWNGLPHVAQNTGRSEWYTPPEIIEAARIVMGGIDTDPASHVDAQTVVKAAKYYTAEEDGLSKPWHGRVWMNPPYSQPLIAQFCEKLLEERETGRATEAITLTNNGTETEWGQRLILHADAICFPNGRVTFWAPDRESIPLQGQMLCYFGRGHARFTKGFSVFGAVVRSAVL
jgi:ParB family chromosome partitioning protein